MKISLKYTQKLVLFIIAIITLVVIFFIRHDIIGITMVSVLIVLSLTFILNQRYERHGLRAGMTFQEGNLTVTLVKGKDKGTLEYAANQNPFYNPILKRIGYERGCVLYSATCGTKAFKRYFVYVLESETLIKPDRKRVSKVQNLYKGKKKTFKNQ